LQRTMAIVEAEKMRVERSKAPEMAYVTLEIPANTGRKTKPRPRSRAD